jgi:VCBS repeat-containing protein
MQKNNIIIQRGSRSRRLAPLVVLLFLVIFTAPALALQTVTLAWDPSPDADVIAYNVYYGTQSASYTNKVTVANVTTATVSNLVEGATYYFAATAYNTSDLESEPSNEVSYTVPDGSNLQPTLNLLNNIAVQEDAGTQTIVLSGISTGSPSEAQTVTVTAVSSNPGVVAVNSLTYTSPNPTASLVLIPLANATGTATITVTVSDGQPSNGSIARTFTTTVSPVNDVPTLNSLANVTINEDAGLQTVALAGISTGAAGETQTLTVTAASSNPALIPNPAVTYTSPNTTGSIAFSPVANLSGSATITVTVNDGQLSNNIIARTFTVTVNGGNDAPTLNALANLTINEDAGAQTVALAGISTGAAGETQTLTVTAASSNPALVPNPTVTYTSPNATGSIAFSPVANLSGSATITVTVNDGQLSNNIVARTFTVTVNGVNDAPTLNSLANVTINEDAGVQTVALAGISTGAAGETQTLTVTAASSNPALIPNPAVTYTSPNTTGSIAFSPVANLSGSAIITVTVNDGQLSNNIATRTFTVTVNPVNDAPTLNSLANVTINEDAGAQTVALAGISTGTAGETQNLTVTAASSNPALIANPTVTYTSPNATGSLAFSPVANLSGSAIITVTVNDGQLSNNIVTRTFTVTVNPVNDAPTLDTIANCTVSAAAGSQTVLLSGISAGAGNETDNLSVSAISSNPSLIPNPSVLYSSPNSSGSLAFVPASSNGTATISVTVNDGQSSNNLAVRTFTVTLSGGNQAPSFETPSDIVIDEDSGPQTIEITGVSSGVAGSDAIAFVVMSTDTALIRSPSISYTNGATNAWVRFTPPADASGMANITVAADNGQTANHLCFRSFDFTIRAVNDLPTMDAIPNVTVEEDSGPTTVMLTGITTGAADEQESLSVTASSSNPSLIPAPSISYVEGSNTASLTLVPMDDGFGVATITVTVNDGQLSNNIVTRTFEVTVVRSTPPLISRISNVIFKADSQSPVISFSVADAETPADNLLVTAVSGNQALIRDADIAISGVGTSRSLQIRPVAGQTGVTTVTVFVNDGTATALATFRVSIQYQPITPTGVSLVASAHGSN